MKTLFVYLTLVSSVAIGIPTGELTPVQPYGSQTLGLTDCQTVPGNTQSRVYDLPADMPTVNGLAATSTGDLIIVSFTTTNVTIINSQGKEKLKFTVTGANILYDIACQEGICFMSEFQAANIHVYRDYGARVTKMAMCPLFQNECRLLSGVSITGNTLWLSCASGVFKMTFDYDFFVTETIHVVAASQGKSFRLSVLDSGIVMPDWKESRLKFFHLNGTEALTPANISWPHDIATDSCGHHYITEIGQQRVILVSETGQFIKEVANATSLQGTPESIILHNNSLFGISKGANDKLFVVDLI